MKTFQCDCGNTLYFENSHCLNCGRDLGYLVHEQQISALEPLSGHSWRAVSNGKVYRKCRNYTDYNVCNWMVEEDDKNHYCQSCRLNHIIPNLTEAGNINLWYLVETAKRRLLYTLYSLDLPVVGRDQEPKTGLAFQFMESDSPSDEFDNSVSNHQHILTGHVTGMITINLLEAEDSAREEMRKKMNEQYRTLLGHFRHESGHFYWDRIIRNRPDRLQRFRELFGDERDNYAGALERYYREGPVNGWFNDCISAYASSHPWEDWAETWAHYLHMVDTLETAVVFGFSKTRHPSSEERHAWEGPVTPQELIKEWEQLSLALNALNRSMGLPDAYPFSISNTVATKLEFIHQVIQDVHNG